MTVIKHYYHIFCGVPETPSTKWPEIVEEHFEALRETGLYDILDFIGVGIVGLPENRELVKAMLPDKVTVVAEADDGWEQTTLSAMDLSEEATILYAHTKGSAFPSVLQSRWRVSMLNCVVYDWERCVEAVTDEGLSAIGAFWRPDPWRHYAGTYWWSNTEYLRTLPPFIYDSRWEAEAWIGKGIGSFGDIGPGHPATDKIERGWSYREGTVEAHSRMFGLMPNRIYKDIEVTRLMQAVHDSGQHIIVHESHPAVKKIKVTTHDRRTGPPS